MPWCSSPAWSAPDLRIVAAQRPFLEALPNVTRQLIFVPEQDGQRMGVVRAVVSHLRLGGAILTFPAGQIEPDPISMPGAVESLASWSESIAIFSRLVPEVKIVVAIVSGVLWPAATQSPITRLRRQQKDPRAHGRGAPGLDPAYVAFLQAGNHARGVQPGLYTSRYTRVK